MNFSDPLEHQECQVGKKPLSKNAQKRLLKEQRFAETREQWKEKQKEKKRMKKSIKSEKPAAAVDIVKPGPPSGSLIFDLAYENLMTDKELQSLVAQICRCYSVNRRSEKPFSLMVFGLTGRTRELFKRAFPDYERWDVQFHESSLTDCLDLDTPCKYLSADANEEMIDVGASGTYIIGGLVDRNRHKNVAFNRAKELDITTSRLPLDSHVKLKSSQVLTILNVVEILCHFRQYQSWDLAIKKSIPARKMDSPNVSSNQSGLVDSICKYTSK